MAAGPSPSPSNPTSGPAVASPQALAGLTMHPGTRDGAHTGDTNPDTTPPGERIQTWTLAKWEDLRTAYTVYHQLCWQNILYYAGQLWILWDKDRRVWYPAVPEDEYTPQPCINEFAPAIDSMTAVFRIPEVEATPKVDNNMDAHEAAEIANVLAKEFMRVNGLLDGGNTKDHDGVGDRAGQLFTLCGNFFSIVSPEKYGLGQKPEFETVPMVQLTCPNCDLSGKIPPTDPRLSPSPSDMLMGQQVSQPQISCPNCGTVVQQSPTTDTRQKKDPVTGTGLTTPVLRWKAKCKVGNPMFALPRPGATTMKCAGWMVWAERMSLDEIYKEWKYEAQPDNQYLDSMEASWEISMNYYFTGYSNLTLATKESALVMIVFIEPDHVKEIPEGGVAVMVNNTVIDYQTWQEAAPVGHPLTHFGYLNMPTTFFYRSPSFDMAQIQKELNRYESIIALHSMTQASDSLVIDENTKVSNVTGRGDRIVYWRSIGPGSKEPHRLQHGTLDEGVYAQRQRLRDALQNVSGAVAVWRGQQTGSVTSAAGISQLRGQAEQMFSKPTGNWTAGWVGTISKGVKMMQALLQPWEISELMGSGHDVQIQKFKGQDLDVILDWAAPKAGLPKTRDEKRQDMLDLYDRKMLDVTDPDVRVRIGELFGETGLDQMFNRDATRARWENDRMSKGAPIQFMPDIEDLATHFFIHSEYIKRLDFDNMKPEVQKALLSHAMETKMALDQLQLLNTESQVEYKAAAIGKPAPIEPKPGTLLGGGPQAQQAGAPGGPGRVDGGPHAPGPGPAPAQAPRRGSQGKAAPSTGRPPRVPSGQSAVPTGPPKGGQR